MNREWLQDLFDLMANKKIKLIVTGEFHEVDAELLVEGTDGKMHELADVIGAEDFESAMRELMEKLRAKRKNGV